MCDSVSAFCQVRLSLFSMCMCVPMALFTEIGRKDPIFLKSGLWGKEMTDNTT